MKHPTAALAVIVALLSPVAGATENTREWDGPAAASALDAMSEIRERNEARIIQARASEAVPDQPRSPASDGLAPRAQEPAQGALVAQSVFPAPNWYQRLGGSNRFETAVQISQDTYGQPELNFGGVVFIANGLNFPDALAAGPLATSWGGPILLVPPTGGLPKVVRDEIVRLAPSDIVILGKTDNVSAQAEQELAELVTDPEGVVFRLAGDNRYQTSALISVFVDRWRPWSWPVDSTTAIITTGLTYADALAGGAAGGFEGAPLLLTNGRGLDPLVAEALQPAEIEPGVVLEFTTVRILGSEATVSAAVEAEVRSVLPDAEIIRYAGRDRFETAGLLNADVFVNPDGSFATGSINLSNGLRFPDALAGATLMRNSLARGPIVLTRSGCIPRTGVEPLAKMDLIFVSALGGVDAVSDEVLTTLKTCP